MIRTLGTDLASICRSFTLLCSVGARNGLTKRTFSHLSLRNSGLLKPSVTAFRPPKPLQIPRISLRQKSTSLDRQLLRLARKTDYSLRRLAKKWEQHYYSVDDCARFARWIGQFHPDQTWKDQWTGLVDSWEAIRSGQYDPDTLLPDSEPDPELASLMYSSTQLQSLQLSAAEAQMASLHELLAQLPERRPLWFPRYPKAVSRPVDAPRLRKGIRRQRRWEEKQVKAALKDGTLWQPPVKRDTSGPPKSELQKKKNPMDLLLKGNSLLPRQTQMVTRKKTEGRMFVPYKRSEREEMKEERRPKVLEDLKKRWDDEDRGQSKERILDAGGAKGNGGSGKVGMTAKKSVGLKVKGMASGRGRTKFAARR